MARNATNKELNAAKAGKNDEFYTQLPDIERELEPGIRKKFVTIK